MVKRFELTAILRWLTATLLLAVLIAATGIDEIIRNFSVLHPGWAIAAILLLILMNAVGGLNVWIMLRVLTPVKASNFVSAYLFGWAVGLITPGQMGDAAQIVLLKKSGIEYAKSSAAYLLDKFISFSILLSIAIYGVGQYVTDFKAGWLIPFFAVLIILFLGLLFLLLNLPDSPPLLGRLRNFARNSLDQALMFRQYRKVVLFNILFTLGKWLLLAICYICLFRAFSADISVRSAALIPIVSTLVGYIPISVGGIGTVEITSIYLFGLVGLDKGTVMSAYIFMRATQYVIAAVFVICLKPNLTKTKNISREPRHNG